MLRALGVTALVAVAGVSPGPGMLRPAHPADEAPRTGKAAMTQQWRIVATDARSHSALMLIADQSTGAHLFYWPTVPHTGVSQVFYNLGAPTGSAGFAVRGIDLHHTATGWVLRLDQGVVKLNLSFTGVRAGPLAAPWPVGQVSGPGVVPFASSLNWAVPVASATVNGTIEHDGTSIPLSGWRGYVDHTWGRFDFSLGLMQHWDWGVVQSAQDTWIVDGFETGPGLSQWKHHDDQWRGVLVHAGAHGVSFCRARAARAGWTQHYQGVEGYVYPQALTATCGGARVTFTRTKNLFDVETGEALSSARTSTGGYGLFDELVSLAP